VRNLVSHPVESFKQNLTGIGFPIGERARDNRRIARDSWQICEWMGIPKRQSVPFAGSEWVRVSRQQTIPARRDGTDLLGCPVSIGWELYKSTGPRSTST